MSATPDGRMLEAISLGILDVYGRRYDAARTRAGSYLLNDSRARGRQPRPPVYSGTTARGIVSGEEVTMYSDGSYTEQLIYTHIGHALEELNVDLYTDSSNSSLG